MIPRAGKDTRQNNLSIFVRILYHATMDCVVETLKDKFAMMLPVLDERGRRLWAGVEAHSLGRGGISRVAEATGLSADDGASGCEGNPLRGRDPLPRGRLRPLARGRAGREAGASA